MYVYFIFDRNVDQLINGSDVMTFQNYFPFSSESFKKLQNLAVHHLI